MKKINWLSIVVWVIILPLIWIFLIKIIFPKKNCPINIVTSESEVAFKQEEIVMNFKELKPIVIPSPKIKQENKSKDDIYEENILHEVNIVRAESGLEQLVRNNVLDKVAHDKLNDMLEYGYWSHTNPFTLSNPWTWLIKESYSWGCAGENLAVGYNSAQQTITAWLNSPNHRDVLKNESYKNTGIAVQGDLVVEVFAD